jgi:hypothetical protein
MHTKRLFHQAYHAFYYSKIEKGMARNLINIYLHFSDSFGNYTEKIMETSGGVNFHEKIMETSANAQRSEITY